MSDMLDYIARLEAENAELRKWKSARMCDCELGHNGLGMAIRECDCDFRRVECERDSLRATVRELQAALDVFAHVGKQLEWVKTVPAMEGQSYFYIVGCCTSLTLYPRHFEIARAALAKSKGQG